MSGLSRARNVLSNWTAFVFSVAVNFVLSPFIVHSLGDAAYGAWVLLGSLVGYLGLLDLGVRGAVTHYVARLHSRGEHGNAGRIASAALIMFAAAGGLALLAATVLAFVVIHRFNIPQALAPVARVVIILGGVNVAVSLIGGVFGGIVVGRERFDYYNAIQITSSALRAVGVFAALSAGGGLIALSLVQLGSTAFTAAASWHLSRKLYPELCLQLRGWAGEHLRAIAGFGIAASAMHVSSSLIHYTDAVIIGAFLPVGFITYYAIAASLVGYTRSLVSGISQTAVPLVSGLQGKGESGAIERAVLTGSRWASLVAFPVLATFLIRGDSFIGLWMGGDYGRQAGGVLRTLTVGVWFGAALQVTLSSLMGIAKHRAYVPVIALEAAANLALSLLLVQEFGIVGVAWGATLPRLIAAGLVAPWYVKAFFGVPIRRFWAEAWLKPSLSMVPFVIGIWAVERWSPANSVYEFLGQVALLMPLAAGGALVMCFSPAERRSYVDACAGLARRWGWMRFRSNAAA